jgi:hypothetical protein
MAKVVCGHRLFFFGVGGLRPACRSDTMVKDISIRRLFSAKTHIGHKPNLYGRDFS